eukprot:scaffold16835_cov52-Isochrysis_galbana.AAC.1
MGSAFCFRLRTVVRGPDDELGGSELARHAAAVESHLDGPAAQLGVRVGEAAPLVLLCVSHADCPRAQ